jgi:hypothetical protein
MKKLLLGTLLLLSTLAFVSCQPELNYECSGYFHKEDWKIVSDFKKTKDTLWGLNKKIKLDYNKDSDSTTIDILPIQKNELSTLPNSGKLKSLINSALIECKYSCNNPETFNPKSISIYPKFGDKKDFYMSIYFNASNSYGVPGELHGSFTYDSKSFKLKDKFIY